jgi:hypothetical protein
MNIRDLSGSYKPAFMNDDEIKEALETMAQDGGLSTKPAYVKEESSIRLISFQEKHTAYLKMHPKVNPKDYLSNLRTMIKIRP